MSSATSDRTVRGLRVSRRQRLTSRPAADVSTSVRYRGLGRARHSLCFLEFHAVSADPQIMNAETYPTLRQSADTSDQWLILGSSRTYNTSTTRFTNAYSVVATRA